jgi:hypothetical protein
VVDVLLLQTVSIAIASAGVFLAAMYYIFQIRHQTRMRQTDLIMRIYATFESIEFQTAILRTTDLKFTRNREDYEKFGPDAKAAFNSINLFFEGLGILVKRKLINMDMVDDLASTDIICIWERHRPAIEGAREYLRRPQIYEYFEYLYDEMKKREQRMEKHAS